MPWGSIAGGLIGSAGSAFGQYLANKGAASSVDKQLAFQLESAKNKYQWTMEDMKKAGLNPMLAYKQGAGGTLPGASYTPQNVMGEAAKRLGEGVSTAVKAKQVNLQKAKLESEIDVLDSQAEKNRQDRRTGVQQEILNSHQTGQVFEQTRNANITGNILESQAVSAQTEARRQKEVQELYRKYPGLNRVIRQIRELTNPSVRIR